MIFPFHRVLLIQLGRLGSRFALWLCLRLSLTLRRRFFGGLVFLWLGPAGLILFVYWSIRGAGIIFCLSAGRGKGFSLPS